MTGTAPNYDLLGRRLQEARNAKAFSRHQLSLLSGVSEASIEHYEIGRRIPNLASLWAITEQLGTTLAELVEGI